MKWATKGTYMGKKNSFWQSSKNHCVKGDAWRGSGPQLAAKKKKSVNWKIFENSESKVLPIITFWAQALNFFLRYCVSLNKKRFSHLIPDHHFQAERVLFSTFFFNLHSIFRLTLNYASKVNFQSFKLETNFQQYFSTVNYKLIPFIFAVLFLSFRPPQQSKMSIALTTTPQVLLHRLLNIVPKSKIDNILASWSALWQQLFNHFLYKNQKRIKFNINNENLL